jgi:hypothetical protein
MYVTPERLATMGLGVDLADLDDVAIRSAVYRASALVDAYCNVPLLPQKHDFRGGTATAEMHEWPIDMYAVSMTPFRFWPWHQPVRTVTAFRIFSTPTIYTEIDAGEVFINNSAGFIEASSLKLTQYGVFGGGVITALVGLWNPQVVVSYTYGYQFPVVAEILGPTDALQFRAQNQWWDSAVTPEIKVNGAVVSSGYTIDYDEGTVLFAAAQVADAIVTASYTHKLPWEIAYATAIIAADDLGEASLRGKGMTGIDSIEVGEISLRRTRRGGTAATIIPEMSVEAQSLLAGFLFRTVR